MYDQHTFSPKAVSSTAKRLLADGRLPELYAIVDMKINPFNRSVGTDAVKWKVLDETATANSETLQGALGLIELSPNHTLTRSLFISQRA